MNKQVNRTAIMFAKTLKTTHYVLVPRRFELIHSDSSLAANLQMAAVMAAQAHDFEGLVLTIEQRQEYAESIVKHAVALGETPPAMTTLLGDCPTALDYLTYATKAPQQNPFAKIVPADSAVFDRSKWFIDFVASPHADYGKLEKWGCV